MSGSTFVALPASGYHSGIAVYHYEWLPALIIVAFAWFLLPVFLRARVYTAPEYLERRFGHRTRLAFSGFLLVANLLIDAAGALYAGATIASVLFPGIPFGIVVAATAVVAGAYVVAGGLGAVVVNDALQAGLILIGGALIACLAWQEVPSWSAVAAAAPPEGLRLMQPASDPVMPWPGLITGVLVIGIYFWCTNQFVIQRALAARSLDHARRGALFAGLLKLPNLFLLILPGVLGTALYPGLSDPDRVFPILAFDLLPVGLRGLLLAALAAAILSSLEAILNSAATLFAMDFVGSRGRGTDDRRLVRIGRLATLAFMGLAAVWTPVIATFPTLWQYLQSVLAYVTPPVVAVFLLGLFWRRGNQAGALAALGVGVPLGLAAWIANEVLGVLDVQYLYASGMMLLLALGLVVVGSRATPPPEPVRVAHTFSR